MGKELSVAATEVARTDYSLILSGVFQPENLQSRYSPVPTAPETPI